MTLRPVTARLPEELLTDIDGLVEEAEFADRSDFLRTAANALLEQIQSRRDGEAIAAAYRKQPWDPATEGDWEADYAAWKAQQRAAG